MSNRDYSQSSDSQLLSGARRNPDAFHEFYRRHCAEIDRWLRGQTGDLDAAAELTAETFAQAWLGLRRFKPADERSGIRWVFGIARNLMREYFRKQRVESGAIAKLKIDLGVSPEHDDSNDLLAGLAEADLIEAIKRLPDHEQQALVLRVVSQLPFREVAGQLNCTENAARLRVSRALRSLRVELGASRPVAAAATAEGGITDGPV